MAIIPKGVMREIVGEYERSIGYWTLVGSEAEATHSAGRLWIFIFFKSALLLKRVLQSCASGGIKKIFHSSKLGRRCLSLGLTMSSSHRSVSWQRPNQ